MREASRCLVLLATAWLSGTPALAQDYELSPPPVTEPTPSNQSKPPASNGLEAASKALTRESEPPNEKDWRTALRFDTKGVEFGPWIRRFIAHLKHNWEPNIPSHVTSLRGHTVMTFVVHKDGSLTDVAVAAPSNVEEFNAAAKQGLLMSNPTKPLPPEYPDERVLFTVTFYYNETPPEAGPTKDPKSGATSPP